tara:strand:+ start:472 stop:1329 length:858 start_codon:yes stop_codon:yes gene_type:complete
MSTNRRRFIQLLTTGMISGASMLAYSRLIGSQWLELKKVKIPLINELHSNPILRILHLSDFHASKAVSRQLIESAIFQGLAQKPDIVCLTGDFITMSLYKENEYADLLKILTKHCPTYACLGNHDGGDWAKKKQGGYKDISAISGFLKRCDIDLLVNESRRISINNQTFNISGLGDLWGDNFTPEKVLSAKISPTEKTILLAHNPDTKDCLRDDLHWDLMLSGHTHGGQIKFPFMEPIILPVQDKRFYQGLYNWNNRHLHISAGIGNVYGIRFNCHPELSILDIC